MTTKNGPPRTGDPGGPGSEATMIGFDETRSASYRTTRPPTMADAVREIPSTPIGLREFVVGIQVVADELIPPDNHWLIPDVLEAVAEVWREGIDDPNELEARFVLILRRAYLLCREQASN